MNLKKYALLMLGMSISSFALPIDWSGSLGFDTTLIKDVRGISDGDCGYADAGTAGDGSQCVKKDSQNARFQTMILKLNPTLIINDSTSIKGELSTGTTRGIFLGEEQGSNQSGAYFSGNEGSSSLNINQLYAELYADTAIYRVGKFAKNFGLGAVINAGYNSWDRFYSSYSGLEANFRLGNLSLVPTFAKIGTGSATAGNGADPSGKYDVTETSVEVSYNNAINGLEGGVFYAKRDAESINNIYTNGEGQSVTLIDVYLKKTWEKLSIGLEAPMISGEVGTAYDATQAQDIDAKAYIFESKYTPSKQWTIGFNAGLVSGDEGNDTNFEGMYLNSNYQLANIMFRYDLNGFQDTGKNPLNSSIRNTTYFNFYTDYKTINWKWTLSFLMAKADQTAQSGSGFFNHERRIYSTDVAAEDQSDDLGYEVDLGFEYEWNPQIIISGFVGYYAVGDYYSFDNDPASELETTNIVSSGLRLSVNF